METNKRDRAINSNSRRELHQLYLSGDVHTRRSVTFNKFTSFKTLLLSAQDEDDTVQYHTAKHNNTSTKALDILSTTQNIDIANAVLFHERTSIEAQIRIIRMHKDINMQLNFLKKDIIDNKVFEILNENSNQDIKVAIALHDCSSPEILTAVERSSKSKKVKKALLLNVRTPQEVKNSIKQCINGNY